MTPAEILRREAKYWARPSWSDEWPKRALELERAAEVVEGMAKALKNCEWGDKSENLMGLEGRFCPVCGGHKSTGHVDDCSVCVAIANYEGGA